MQTSENLLAQRVCDAFDLGTLTTRQDAGGTRNRNFIFETTRGRWFVRRRFHGYSKPEHLAFDHAVASHLHERGVAVPQPLSTENGATWWNDGENIWEAFPFVTGRALRDGDPQDVTALGIALATWHRNGRDFPRRYIKAAARSETTPDFLRERLARIEQESPATISILPLYRHTVETAAAALSDDEFAMLPHTLIHGDVQPANLLLDNGSVRAFVDLDWCTWQARIYDLCFAILICCANHAEPFDGGNIWSLTQTPLFNHEAIDNFLAAYQANTEPLTPAEKKALRPQFLLTWCHARTGGALKVAPEDRLKFLQRPPHIENEDWLPEALKALAD